MDLLAPIRAFDHFQQRSRLLAFPLAVVKKFSDDRAAGLAALIAYYGFFALFPLLLVFVTILGFVLEGNPSARESILNSTLARLPVIGPQLQLHSLQGSALALAVGVVASLLAGLAITEQMQYAFAQIWAVPIKRRPSYIKRRLRGLGLLAVLGGLTIVSAVASQLASVGGNNALTVVFELVASLLVNVGVFFAAFRFMTPDDVQTGDLMLGACVAAVGWTVLQALGGYLVSHVLTRQRDTYGVFALVIGLLSWIYLGAQLMLYAAEINVVRARRLWPRSLLEPSAPADRRTLQSLAEIEERVDEEQIDVRFQDKDRKRRDPDS